MNTAAARDILKTAKTMIDMGKIAVPIMPLVAWHIFGAAYHLAKAAEEIARSSQRYAEAAMKD